MLEILPLWSALPDPGEIARRAASRGFSIHSAHGAWGGQAIRARRVDLGSTDAVTHEESIDDLMRCVDWLAAAGGKCLVVHPGGLSDPEEQEHRRAALARGLLRLADHARGPGVLVCVENMPPGVHPGSRMTDLAALLAELAHPQLALALDTGHANLGEGLSHETRAAGTLLATTHVHDNDGRQDTHLPARPRHDRLGQLGRTFSIPSATPARSSWNASSTCEKTLEVIVRQRWPVFRSRRENPSRTLNRL